MSRLEGKVAIVTGAGSGFGEGIAKAYASEGANVIIADINSEGGQRVEAEINSKWFDSSKLGTALFTSMNVVSQSSWEQVLALAKETYGKLDIVVNNAGITYNKKPSVEVTEKEFDTVVNVNMKSIFWSVKVIMPYFVSRKSGIFVNASSVAGMKVRPGQVWYDGTKGFLNTITQGLAAEYGPAGIRINSICPLRSATGMLEKSSGVADTPEERERFAKSMPLGRMSELEDIVKAVVFLASDESKFVTGTCLPVDGERLTI